MDVAGGVKSESPPMPQHRRTDATKTDQLSSLDSQEAVAPSPFAVQLLLLAVTGVTFTLSRGDCRFTGLAEKKVWFNDVVFASFPS